MSDNASPRPWKYCTAPSRNVPFGNRDWIEDATGSTILENVGHLDGPRIVAAVNAHSALVEALRPFAATADRLDEVRENVPSLAGEYEASASVVGWSYEAAVKARTAIALAEAKP